VAGKRKVIRLVFIAKIRGNKSIRGNESFPEETSNSVRELYRATISGDYTQITMAVERATTELQAEIAAINAESLSRVRKG
jgi:hypothetical protein